MCGQMKGKEKRQTELQDSWKMYDLGRGWDKNWIVKGSVADPDPEPF